MAGVREPAVIINGEIARKVNLVKEGKKFARADHVSACCLNETKSSKICKESKWRDSCIQKQTLPHFPASSSGDPIASLPSPTLSLSLSKKIKK